MTIEIIPDSREIQSDTDFMKAVGEALDEAAQFGDDITLTVTSMHRDKEGGAVPTVLALKINNGETIYHHTQLEFDQVANCLDAVLENSPEHHLPKMGVDAVSDKLLSIHNCEYCPATLSEEIEKYGHQGASLQGLVSELTFKQRGEVVQELQLSVAAEVYADTEKQERQILQENNLNPDDYTPSSPNKIISLFSIDVLPIDKIVGR